MSLADGTDAQQMPASQPPPGIPEAPAAPAAAAPMDADDTRGQHFRRYLGSPVTLIIAASVALAVFIGLSMGPGPAYGGAGVALVLFLTLLIAFFLANSAAQADFFRAYAQGRSLQLNEGRTSLPPVSDLLRKGDSRYAEKSWRGTLPGGLNGMLALYTYEDETTDSEGNSDTTYYHFTVAMSELPELAPFMQELAVQRRSGFRFLDSAEDKFRKRQRVALESDAADKRFEVFIGQNDDMNRARQVFSPTFIVWLAEQAPDDFAFEIVAGVLVCNVKGHKKSAVELDSICQGSSAVARRLVEEARE